MSYERTYLIGGHVLRAGISSGGQVLWEVMYNGGTCLMSGHVLQDMSYSKTYRKHIMRLEMSYMMTCLVRF